MADNKDKKILNVPALRFPEFSGEWKRIRVSDLLDFYSTNSLSWEQLEYKLNEPYNLHYGLIHVGLPILVDLTKDELPSIKEGNVPKKYELCKEGDIAFADASEDTNEVAKVVEFYNLDGKKVVCGLHTIHGRNNNGQTAKGFLGYCFSSTVFHNQIRRIAQGTKIYSINTRNFSEVFVGLPSMSEQQKIATLLRLMDERIATQNKIIEKYESLIQAISQKVLRPSEYWNEYRLCELADIRSGYSGNQVSHKTAYAVSRIETISTHRIDMLRVGYVQDIPSEYKLNVGDILFSNINSIQYIGNTAFVDKEYNLYHGMNLLRIIPKPSLVIPRFLHLILCTSMAIKHFQSICNKAVSQASINQTSLGKIMLHIPPLTCQEQICDVFESVEQRLNLEVYYLKRIQLQKNYLLRPMFI